MQQEQTGNAPGTGPDTHLEQAQKFQRVKDTGAMSGHGSRIWRIKTPSSSPVHGDSPGCVLHSLSEAHRGLTPAVTALTYSLAYPPCLPSPLLHLLPGTKSLINSLHPRPCLRVCFVGGTKAEKVSGPGAGPE